MVLASYMVQDSDLNFQTSSGVFKDTDAIPVNIYVYRDVTLETISVGVDRIQCKMPLRLATRDWSATSAKARRWSRTTTGCTATRTAMRI